jgi:hypothetical protein
VVGHAPISGVRRPSTARSVLGYVSTARRDRAPIVARHLTPDVSLVYHTLVNLRIGHPTCGRAYGAGRSGGNRGCGTIANACWTA